jgi:hypothetical protein
MPTEKTQHFCPCSRKLNWTGKGLITIADFFTNCMKQSPSSEAKSCSVSQEISSILWKLEFPIRFTGAYHNSGYTHVSHFFKIQFNIALLSMPKHTHTHTHTHMQHDYLSPFLERNNAKQKTCKVSQISCKIQLNGI